MLITIALTREQIEICSRALLECFAGYAGSFLPKFLGVTRAALDDMHKMLKALSAQDNPTLSLPQESWRLLYEAINAVIYELGEEELDSITGHDVRDYLNTARSIYAGAYARFCIEPF